MSARRSPVATTRIEKTMPTRRRQSVLLALVAAVPLLAGCSAFGEQPLPHSSWNIPTAPPTAGIGVAYTMPDLGPSPSPKQPTSTQEDESRTESKADAWKTVLKKYPDAVRPSATFEAFTTFATQGQVLADCFTAAGVSFDKGYDTDEKLVSAQPRAKNEEDALAVYVCRVQHPHSPDVGPSGAQLGYLYDYLTKFIVPCYEANGITNDPPPTREYFVDHWPTQNWCPFLTTKYEMGGPEEEAIARACPMPK